MQRGNGAVIGKQNTPTTSVATGVWALNEVQRAVLGGNWPASTIVDPYFENVSLLLHGNGTNGAQNNTFLDSSTNNFTITRNGNTTQGTFTPYGANWGNFFNGSSDYLTLSTNTALVPSADFTLECWINPNLLTAAPNGRCIAMSSSWASGGWMLRHSATAGKIDFFVYDNSFTSPLIQSSTVMSVGIWYHIAVTRSGNSWRMFVNGTQEGGTQTYGGTPSLGLTNIGWFPTGVDYFGGYISNLRLVKGTAVYTSAFTPSAAPLTAITNTSLLTCQSNRFIDNSTNAFAITVNGSPSVQRFSPFNPTAAYSAATIGGSGYFDGTGDYLTLAPGAAFAFGTGDFTVEAWIYPTAALGQMYIIDARNSGQTSTWSFNFGYGGTSNEFNWGSSGSIIANGGTTSVIQNAWNHVVYTRSGTSGALFANGVRVASVTDSTNYSTSPTTSYIGSRFSADAPYFFQGYMAVRVVKGTAVYSPSSSTLTVPTSPLTAVTNTVLLLSMTNGGIIDNAMMNDLETVGNAQISTSVSKFGGGSLAFDGSGDALSIPASQNFAFGTGDFTIEFWWYPNSLATFQPLFYNSDDVAVIGTGEYGIVYNTSLGMRFFLNAGASGTVSQGSTSGWSTGQWYHVAVVRSGTTLTIYRNGVSIASGTNSAQVGVASIAVSVGRGEDTTCNGYIDDLRLTRGYARYTANFTPPTAPFPDQ